MATSRLSRNNALAGLFVLVCVGLFVTVVVLLGSAGDRLAGKSDYTIEFTLADGAEGLEHGSVVKLGGKKVGRVLSSTFMFDSATPPQVTGIAVKIEVWSELQLYDDAEVNLVRPLLGSESTINISKLRISATAKPVSPSARIKGRIGPPGFLTEADYARVQDVLAKVSKWADEIDPHIKPIVEDVEKTLANARDLSDKANKSWDRWSGDITDVIDRVKRAVEPFDTITQDVKDGVQEVRNVIAKGDEFITRNRPVLDQTLDDARELVHKAKGEGYDKAIALLDTAQEAMRHAADAARDASDLTATKVPELKEIVTTASLAAQQLKLVVEEIRAAPWRLLYQPNKKEMENELLYNSIRAYGDSMSQVRSAAMALEAASRNVAQTPPGQAPTVSPEEIAALAAKLKDSISKGQEQEKLFFDRWIREAK